MSGFHQIQTGGDINKLISVYYNFMTRMLLGDAAQLRKGKNCLGPSSFYLFKYNGDKKDYSYVI